MVIEKVNEKRQNLTYFAKTKIFTFCEMNVIMCIKNGSCGASTTYIFDNCTGTLFISGQGAMSDYTNEPAPWSSFKNNITSVIIECKVTSIGNNCFSEWARNLSV